VYVVRRGVVIGFITKWGNGSNGVLTRRKLSGSLTLPTTTTGVVGTPQMMFTDPIMTTHVNTIADWPPMSSTVIGRYRNSNAMCCNPSLGLVTKTKTCKGVGQRWSLGM
jgi:hypothetical protein